MKCDKQWLYEKENHIHSNFNCTFRKDVAVSFVSEVLQLLEQDLVPQSLLEWNVEEEE
jgi:hypothetical protein